MQITVATKNIPLTDGLRQFITSKIEKFSRYSSRGLSHIQVILDVDRKKGGAIEDAVVEFVGLLHGKHLAVRATGSSFYTAFYDAMAKMKTVLSKQKERLVPTQR